MNDEIIIHLLKYLQNMIDNGQHKLFYNDLMHDEKVIDIINAITNLQEENIKFRKCIKEIDKYIKESGDLSVDCYYKFNELDECNDIRKIMEEFL